MSSSVIPHKINIIKLTHSRLKLASLLAEMPLASVKTKVPKVGFTTQIHGSYQSNSFNSCYNQTVLHFRSKCPPLLLFGISSVCLCLYIKMYLSAFPEEISFMRCLFFFFPKPKKPKPKTKKVCHFPRGDFPPCYAKVRPVPRHHFLGLSEFSHEPSSSTSRRTTRSISATS